MTVKYFVFLVHGKDLHSGLPHCAVQLILHAETQYGRLSKPDPVKWQSHTVSLWLSQIKSPFNRAAAAAATTKMQR